MEIFRTSTPEPSPDGIEWSVEKDVTRYSDTFRRGGDVEMLIGNVVDDTYTGVLDVKVTLTFYAQGGAVKSAATPDRVLALQDGTLTTPRNSERVVAEVYATGSGGGCEEYWYLTVPDPRPVLLQGGQGLLARCRSRWTANSRHSQPYQPCGPAAGPTPSSGT